MDKADIKYMERALDLAERGRGQTSPNPVVGAVIVRDGTVLGEGWHKGVGLDHAEVAAIRDALGRAGVDGGQVSDSADWKAAGSVCSGATMYVTLEPCCTQGRTPPCTDALIASGFGRVVVGAIDPSPAVNGRGLELLREAGIACEVADGELSHRAMRQNSGLRKTLAQGLPFVTYKYAMTLDGRVASDTGDSRWISGTESRGLVHEWRAASDAVVVGAGTLRADDPTLTARDVECVRQPLRVVVDAECTLSANSKLVLTADAGAVLVICSEEVERSRRDELESWGVDTAVVRGRGQHGLDPREVCKSLAARGAQSILLEGGPRLAAAWWAAGLIDKVAAFVCPRIVSGERAFGAMVGAGALRMDESAGLEEVTVERVGEDVLITGYTGGPS